MTSSAYRYTLNTGQMIRSFRDKEAEKLFRNEFSKRYQAIEKVARRMLDLLHAAGALADLGALPGNKLEALKSDRKGQHSIRINDQFRVCFTWSETDAYEVEIVDYH